MQEYKNYDDAPNLNIYDDLPSFSIYTEVIIPWLVTLPQGANRQQYQAIISGLLAEVLKQHKSRRREAMNFVLDRWNYSSESNNVQINIVNNQVSEISISTISNLLKRGIKLFELTWLIALTGGIVLTSVGVAAVSFTNNLSQPPQSVTPSPPPEKLPVTQNIDNSILVFSGINVKDIDSPNFDQGTLTIKFTANPTPSDRFIIRNQGKNPGEIGLNGAEITYGGNIIGSFTGGDGITPLIVTFNDNSSPDAAQALLRNIYYQNTSSDSNLDSRTVQVQVSDGSKEKGDSNILPRSVIVTTENKEPIIAVPASKTIKENTSLTINGITISDPDSSKLAVNLTVNNGLIKVKPDVAKGLTVDKNGTSSVTLNGTLTQINTTLANATAITYQVNKDFSGDDSLKITVNDGGKIIKGKVPTSLVWPTNALNPKTASNSIKITVNPLNIPPEITVPNQQITKENTSLVINNIKISDLDTPKLTVVLSVKSGKLTIKSDVPQGLTDKNITKNNTNLVTLAGTVAQINSTLNDSTAITYSSNQDFNGKDVLAITANDSGKKNVTNSIPITVNPSNRPPVLTFSESRTIDNGITITKEEAVNIIQKYLIAKAKIFAPPYDRQLAASLTTGKIYEDIIKSEGSLDWLQRNNAYYQFGKQMAEPLADFSATGNQVKIDVKITEEYAYYEYGILKLNDTNVKDYRFTLQLEDGVWKIANRQSLDY